MIELEICVDTARGLHDAGQAPIDRIELCSALAAGGLTPGAGLIDLAARIPRPTLAMIRPRAGDFTFCPDEEAMMLVEIETVRKAGLAGVVLGAAQPDGTLDAPLLARLIARASGLDLTLHRAFDLTPDPFEALETAISLGFRRILTSGHAPRAVDGQDMLARLVKAAAGRITVMAGSGITPDNAGMILRHTGVTALHASCSSPQNDATADRFGFGTASQCADPARMTALRQAITSHSK